MGKGENYWVCDSEWLPLWWKGLSPAQGPSEGFQRTNLRIILLRVKESGEFILPFPIPGLLKVALLTSQPSWLPYPRAESHGLRKCAERVKCSQKEALCMYGNCPPTLQMPLLWAKGIWVGHWQHLVKCELLRAGPISTPASAQVYHQVLCGCLDGWIEGV